VQAIRNYVQQAAPGRLQAEMGPGAADITGIVPDIGAKLPDLPTPPALVTLTAACATGEAARDVGEISGSRLCCGV